MSSALRISGSDNMVSIYPDVGEICQFNHISEYACTAYGHLRGVFEGLLMRTAAGMHEGVIVC